MSICGGDSVSCELIIKSSSSRDFWRVVLSSSWIVGVGFGGVGVSVVVWCWSEVKLLTIIVAMERMIITNNIISKIIVFGFEGIISLGFGDGFLAALRGLFCG